MRKFYTKIDNIAGNVATLKATGVGYEELALVEGSWGKSLAQVIRVNGDNVSLQVLPAPAVFRPATASLSPVTRCASASLMISLARFLRRR